MYEIKFKHENKNYSKKFDCSKQELIQKINSLKSQINVDKIDIYLDGKLVNLNDDKTFPNFTFKNAEVYKFSSFFAGSSKIKFQGNVIGNITELRNNFAHDYGENNYKWEIRIAVKKERTEKNNSNFEWKKVAKKFDTLQDAKNFINENKNLFHKQFNFHFLDE